MYLDAPAYTLPKTSDSVQMSTSAFGNIPDYYSAAASIHLIAKWLAYIKEQGVYDNTRIVIASDHGVLIRTGVFKDNDVCQVEGCNPLLLYKDFDAHGSLQTDNAFMTQCDVAVLATQNLAEHTATGGFAVHPYSHALLDSSQKQGDQYLFMNHNNTLQKNLATAYAAKSNEWYTVHDDIFVAKNWRKGAKTE